METSRQWFRILAGMYVEILYQKIGKSLKKSFATFMAVMRFSRKKNTRKVTQKFLKANYDELFCKTQNITNVFRKMHHLLLLKILEKMFFGSEKVNMYLGSMFFFSKNFRKK